MKKHATLIMNLICVLGMLAILLSSFAGCGGKKAASGDGSMTGTIDVVSRESGSGTRSAFTELLGIVDASENDATTASAEVTNSTAVMTQTVAGDEQSIGYVSLGLLVDQVKAVKVDGVEPSVENINNGTYKISRPFNVVFREGSLSEPAQDFLNYILSEEGQNIIEKNNYIRVGEAKPYTATQVSGNLSIAGSTSVGPVMEALADAYKKVNPNVTISIEQNGSTAGIQAAQNGVVDFGMASRDLTDEEAAALTGTAIARDGIAVIVNAQNPVDNLTSEEVKQIYLGNLSSWDEVSQA